MAIFSLIAKLGLDGSAYETGLKKATSLTDKFRGTVGSQLGAALSVAAVGAFANKVVQTADAIGDLSEQLNISTDDVQRLQILANQTGVSFEAMAKSMGPSSFILVRAPAALNAFSPRIEIMAD